ncbi:MAG: hypothetical protein K8R02_03495 [Anaerohalosphaeraceae bacterium]|nr:hypothetical protein [Anaerohalosphaeraceae bacterium]
MLKPTIKKLINSITLKGTLAAILIVSVVFTVYAEDSQDIDLSKLNQSNPFAQFAGASQTPQPTAVIAEPKPDFVVETITLKFLDAMSLKNSMENMSGTFGNIEPDAKTNSLIICDSQENVDKIIEQIKNADKKPEQIMIEVVLIDVKLNDDTEIGVNWDFLSNNSRTNTYRQNFGYTDRIGLTNPTTGEEGTIENLTALATSGTGGAFSILNGDIRNIIKMLQTKQDVEILASPRVMVVSGQTASIEAIEEIPYTETSDTSEGGSLTSTEFKDVGVKLKVGAILTDDGSILLNIESEQKVTTGTTGGVPQVDARIVQTALMLKDGQLVTIGGLRRKELKEQAKQIPILGDLPGIGFAFKTTDSIENHSELVVLISPHIYKDEAPTERQMEKYNEITKRPMLKMTRKDVLGNDKKEKKLN